MKLAVSVASGIQSSFVIGDFSSFWQSTLARNFPTSRRGPALLPDPRFKVATDAE